MNPRRLALGLVLLAIAVIVPRFLGEYQNFVLCLAGAYAIGALGLVVFIGHGGMISLGHAGFSAVGAYTATLLMVDVDMSFWLALPLSAVAGAVVGGVLGWPMLRLSGPYLAVATFGFAIVVPEVISRWSAFGIGDPDLFGGAFGLEVPTAVLGDYVFDSSLRFWYVVLAVLVISLLLLRRGLASRHGSALRAYREAPVAAAAFGIPTRRLRIGAFAVAGAFAGLSGTLQAHLIGVLGPQTFSLTMSLLFLTIVVLGGVSSAPGAVAAALGIIVFREWLTGWTSNLQLWYGLVLLVAVVASRDGISGGARWAWRRIAGSSILLRAQEGVDAPRR